MTTDITLDEHTSDLTALLGSRICHDLISPIGAIANGVELLAMSGQAGGPEVALISQSVAAANARIRFFRIAFGLTAAGQRIGLAELLAITDDMSRGSRTTIGWSGPTDAPRSVAKAVFLALLCLETAMPWGGQVQVTLRQDGWSVTGQSTRLKMDTTLWQRLTVTGGGALAAAHVQFALLSDAARRQGRMLQLVTGDERITLSV